MTRPARPRRPAGTAYPWVLVALLWTVSCVNAADRSIFNAVKPLVRSAFHVSDVRLGLIDTTFFWVYALGAFAFGRLGDSVRRRNLIMIGLVGWSAATGMMPFAASLTLLFGARGLVALGESTYYPSATALIGRWHAPATRSRALAIHQTAIFFGSGLGGWVAGMLADRLGWGAPFAVFGCGGLGLAVILLLTLRDDAPGQPAVAPVAGPDPFALVVANRPALLLCLVYLCGTAASSAVLNWCNVYAHDVLGLNLAGSALVGPMMIALAGFFAVLISGWLADHLIGRVRLARFYLLLVGLLIAGVFLALFPLAHTPSLVATLLFATSFGKGLFDGCIYAAMFDLVEDRARSTVTGLMTMTGFIGAGITTVALPVIASRAGIASAFAAMAILYAVAVLILIAVLKLARSPAR